MPADRIELTVEQLDKFHPHGNEGFYGKFMPQWGFRAALPDCITLIGRPRPAVAGPVEHSEGPVTPHLF
jgi:hypothetical protein